MINLLSITEINLNNKRVLIREDFNVPIVQDRIINDRRIQAALPTIEYALHQNAAVILLSHLGRPSQDTTTSEFSLAPVAKALSNYLKQPVRFVKEWVNGIDIKPGEVVLCENVRLQKGETTNELALAKKIAALSDVFVMDAFAVAHRAAASTVGAIYEAQTACAGLLLLSELENLLSLQQPEPPFVALMGGAKTTTKLKTLEGLAQRADHLLLGGALANTFLNATHLASDKTLHESYQHIEHLMQHYGAKIHLPYDGVVKTIDETGKAIFATKSISEIKPNEIISDIGPRTIQHYTQILNQAETIFWNGPMGVFESAHLQEGTQKMAQAIAEASAFSIAGGGETLTAMDQWQLYPSCISTGGGALLDYLAGEPLPAIQALQARSVSL